MGWDVSKRLRAGLSGHHSLMPLFHLLHTAQLQRKRGFHVSFPGLEQDASYDLLLTGGPEIANTAAAWQNYGAGRILVVASPDLAHPVGLAGDGDQLRQCIGRLRNVDSVFDAYRVTPTA